MMEDGKSRGPDHGKSLDGLPVSFICEDNCKSDPNLIVSDSQIPISLENERNNSSERSMQFWQSLYSFVQKSTVFSLAVLCIWILSYILFDKEALRGGSLFALGVLELTAILFGLAFDKVHLPPLLGMITAGLIHRNLFSIYFEEFYNEFNTLTNPLRAISVVILLSRGAFGVIPRDLKTFSNIVPQLSVFACVFEAIVGGFAVYFVLGFEAPWAALMGCIFSAMSGACTLPYLFALGRRKFPGTERVLKIAITGCGLDAILAISLAELCFGVIFSKGTLSSAIRHGPFELMIGMIFGVSWGGLIGLYLGKNNSNNDLRVLAVLTGGIISLLGLTKFGFPRGGPLGTYISALIPSILWRKGSVDGENNDKLNKTYTKFWYFFQPLLFGIIGSRVDLKLVDWEMISYAVICIFISLFGRLISVFFLVSCADLNLKEKLFLVTSWMPKGTVQAALGPVALEVAANLASTTQATLDMGERILHISVTTIIISSTFGSLCLLLIGQKFLSRLHI